MLHGGGSVSTPGNDNLAYGGDAGGFSHDGGGQGSFFTPTYAVSANSAGFVASDSISSSIADPLKSDPLTLIPGDPPTQPDLSKAGTGYAQSKHDLSTIGKGDPPTQDDLSTIGKADPPTQDDLSTIGKADPPAQDELSTIGKADSPTQHELSTTGKTDPATQHDLSTVTEADRADPDDLSTASEADPPNPTRSLERLTRPIH